MAALAIEFQCYTKRETIEKQIEKSNFFLYAAYMEYEQTKKKSFPYT